VTDELDIQRIQSYQLYEQIYWTVPDTFKASFRGTNNLSIYIPSGRVITDTTDQYCGAQFALSIIDKVSGRADSPDAIAASQAMTDLFARERFLMKYGGNKLYGIMRGDWLWHVTANPAKLQGSRVTISAIDPAMYFPITHEDDVDVIVGCHLAVQITTPDGPRVHRLTYRYLLDDATGMPRQPRVVTVEESVFELNQWELPEGKPSAIIRPLAALPPTITALPVYHIPNTYEPGNPFGSSEMRGLERIMSSVNQTISDEDLALALDGIGMYATDAPEPTDDDGNIVGWRLGPGRVVHVPEGSNFNRVTGISSTTPYGEHYDRLWSALKQAGRTPDVAVGVVDIAVAQSGIALALQLAPMTAKIEKKNTIVTDVHTQMFFDIINGWYPAYEQTTFTDLSVKAMCGSAIPVDRAARFAELTQMLADKVIDVQFYRDEVTKLGYVFPADIQTRIDSAAAADAANQATALGVDRLAAATNDTLPPAGAA
jgi:hypothetical protein